MFTTKEVNAWIGNVAVIYKDGGCLLIDWTNVDKRLFIV
jgi:hypothetical protein